MIGENGLPALVQRYLDRVVPDCEVAPRQVVLTQTGELRLKQDARWLRFTATQETAVHEVGFSWRARVRVLPLVSVHVSDRHAAGEGSNEVRVIGRIPLMRESGPYVSEGSALRYLAELPWTPYAMAANHHLEWHALDAETVEVATQAETARASLQLRFDAEPRIVDAWSEGRPHKEGGTFIRRRWGGVYSDYGVVGGIEIPRRAEVSWDLPEGRFPWFRCTITSLDVRT